jgi:hypothetical protein
MKKLFLFLFASMLLCQCACVLSQVPPQYIYADVNCTALIPDYKSKVVVTGGCSGFIITQLPASGTILTVVNSPQNILIKAINPSGKNSQLSFTLTMLDTITPKITPLPELLTYQLNQSRELYNAADKVFNKLRSNININDFWTSKLLIHVSWDSLGYRKALAWYGDSLSYNIWVQDTTKLTVK